LASSQTSPPPFSYASDKGHIREDNDEGMGGFKVKILKNWIQKSHEPFLSKLTVLKI